MDGARTGFWAWLAPQFRSTGFGGAGPYLDNLETREERNLIPGIGFSIEPEIYLPSELGMRSEVDAFLQRARALITPEAYQKELIVV